MPHSNSAHSNEAGKYIAMYLEDFPNELDIRSADIYQNMRRPKNISFVMASTENIQARYASQWLVEDGRCQAGRETAVVMCDEAILPPIIQSLPPEADKVNITSGFPLGMTPIASFVSLLFDTYTSGITGKGTSYRAQYASKLLTHAYTRYISENANDLYATIKEQHLVYPNHDVHHRGYDEQRQPARWSGRAADQRFDGGFCDAGGALRRGFAGESRL